MKTSQYILNIDMQKIKLTRILMQVHKQKLILYNAIHSRWKSFMD